MGKILDLINISNLTKNKFIEFFDLDKKLVFFGADDTAKYILDVYASKLWWAQSKQEVAFIVDDDKAGGKLCGKPIVTFGELLEQKNDVKVVITGNKYVEQLKQLKQHGFTFILEYCNDPFWRIGDPIYFMLAFTEHLKALHHSVYRDVDKLERAYTLFNDTLSKEVFLALIRYRLDFDLLYLREIMKFTTFYFDEDFIEFDNSHIFIDVGACLGASIVDFQLHSRGKYKAIYAFEASSSTFESLQNNITLFDNTDHIHLINAAVCNRSQKVKFSSSETIGVSKLSEDGTEDILGIRLDDFWQNELKGKDEKLFIKMDIEGAEVEALNGARELITTLKPNLAICVYHNPEDIWKIPNLIMKFNPMYKLYIRHKSLGDVNGTICYAIA